MTQDLKVVARRKGSDPANPLFSRTMTVAELIREVIAAIPVDLVYFVVPHPDGKGYSLREAGAIVANIIESDAIDAQIQEEHQTQPEPPQPPAQPTPKRVEVVKPIPSQSHDVASGYVFGTEAGGEPSPFVFERPRRQSELLAERGLEQAPDTKVKKRNVKRRKLAGSEEAVSEEKDVSPDDPRLRGGGKVQINKIIEATPAEAAAASKVQGELL